MTIDVKQLEEKESLVDEVRGITAHALSFDKHLQDCIGRIKGVAAMGAWNISYQPDANMVTRLREWLNDNGFRATDTADHYYGSRILHISWREEDDKPTPEITPAVTVTSIPAQYGIISDGRICYDISSGTFATTYDAAPLWTKK
jgi:hypothetical protein